MKQLVFATNNSHKLSEARSIAGAHFEILSLSDIGCHDDIPETSPTLEGNALQKARWIKERYGYDCFADDTGLMVDALGGEPGVYSARYAGPDHDSEANMRKLLDNMRDKDDRKAHFTTVVALIKDGGEHTFEGRVDGTIAREPRGADGFGYDPVFIAGETGKTFAEMDAAEKNAISHRGRAMRKLQEFLGALMLTLVVLIAPSAAWAADWRLHPTFDGNVDKIIDTPDYTYILSFNQPVIVGTADNGSRMLSLFRYNKENEDITFLNCTNRLNATVVTDIAYNPDRKYLLAAYADGNIDLIFDSGEVVNVPALKMADGYLKNINGISFDPAAGLAYIATDFGYVVINDRKGEVLTSRNYGSPSNAVASYDGKIFIGTDSFVKYADAKETSIDNFTNVPAIMTVKELLPYGDRLYVSYTLDWKDRMGYIERWGDGYLFTPVQDEDALSLQRCRDGIFVSGSAADRIYDEKGNVRVYPKGGSENGISSSWGGTDFMVDCGRKGLERRRASGPGETSWTVTATGIRPNAAANYKSTGMAYSPKYGMLVRNHGNNKGFTTLGDTSPDLVSGLSKTSWTPYSTAYRLPGSKSLTVYNPNGIAIDPLNPDQIWCGSALHGMLRLDLADVKKSLRIGSSNDEAANTGASDFVAAAPFYEGMPRLCSFSTPAFDSNGYMWVAFFNYDKSQNDEGGYELWHWSPEDRAASVTASSFKALKKWEIKGFKASNAMQVVPLAYSANRNVLVLASGSTNSTLTLIDHKGTVDTRGDDTTVSLSSALTDTDGASIDYGAYLYKVFEDPLTGLVWVGNGRGVFYFNPQNVLKGNDSMTRVKVARNDGTQLADYLLEGVPVYDICQDSSGRKWFATRGAGVVCTSSNGATVVKSYTTDNSSLPDNVVYSLAYNPDNNSIVASTDAGLAELYLSGGSGDSEEDVKIYPNPVRPDYYGYINIEGLADGALVKITDSAGNLIREIGFADGGTAQWDATNMNGKRVRSGVYYVLASEGPDGDAFSAVGKIVVVN